MKKNMWAKISIMVLISFLCVTTEIIAQPHSLKKPGQSEYIDKNKHFKFYPPQGWERKEFDDPRSKVEFYVPLAGNNREASLFFLSQVINAVSPSGGIDIFKESENRVFRLKAAGAKDAQFKKIKFCGEDASLIEAVLPNNQVRMYALMFVNYGRIYTISFTTTPQLYDKYFPIVEASLATFQCLAPESGVAEKISQKGLDEVRLERIRVLVNALGDPDMGSDIEASLRAYGDTAIPALLDIEKTGTAMQRVRARRILGRTGDGPAISKVAQLRYGLVAEGILALAVYYESDPEKVEVPKKEDGTYVLPKDTKNGNRYTLYQGLKNSDGTIKVMKKITHPQDKAKVKTFLVTDVSKKFITGKTGFTVQD